MSPPGRLNPIARCPRCGHVFPAVLRVCPGCGGGPQNGAVVRETESSGGHMGCALIVAIIVIGWIAVSVINKGKGRVHRECPTCSCEDR